MPLVFLRPFIAGLTTLQAQDALHWSTVSLVGSNSLKQSVRSKILRQWQRDAQRYDVRRPRPSGPAQVAASLAGLGITTSFVPRVGVASDSLAHPNAQQPAYVDPEGSDR